MGYAQQVPHALGIWTHESRPICFYLCVDDFGIKYFNKDDAQHPLSSLQNRYTVTRDWHGRNFCGLTIDWNYDKQYVDISMPKYINHLLTKLNYTPHLYVIDEIQNVINNLNPNIQVTNQQLSLRVQGCAGTVAEHPKTGHESCAPERAPTDNPLQLVGGIANPRLISDSMRSKSHY